MPAFRFPAWRDKVTINGTTYLASGNGMVVVSDADAEEARKAGGERDSAGGEVQWALTAGGAVAGLVGPEGTTRRVFATIAAAPVDAVAATGTVTDGNSSNYDVNQTITVGTKVYKFVETVSKEGDIKIGATADHSLNNFVNAINLDGVLGEPNVDFKVAAANPDVTAAPVTSHATVLTARVKGVVGNAIALAKTGAYGSVSGAFLANGVDGTVGKTGEIVIYSTQPYICLTDATTATSGAWKKLSVASL